MRRVRIESEAHFASPVLANASPILGVHHKHACRPDSVAACRRHREEATVFARAGSHAAPAQDGFFALPGLGQLFPPRVRAHARLAALFLRLSGLATALSLGRIPKSSKSALRRHVGERRVELSFQPRVLKQRL